ncbi:MAG: hypothetical protein JWR21_2722 [Herminiimonas sp.]|nr:hypothetical protein [Herminiimonas sp.]
MLKVTRRRMPQSVDIILCNTTLERDSRYYGSRFFASAKSKSGKPAVGDKWISVSQHLQECLTKPNLQCEQQASYAEP